MDTKLNISIEGKENPILTILEGKALDPRERQSINISGTITAPADYAEIRPVNPATDHIEYSRSKMEIKLFISDADELGDSITGKLSLNPDLANFSINANTKKSPKDLASFLKMNRMYFFDKDENVKLVTALTNFTAKVQNEMESKNDERGNKKEIAIKKVISNIPLNFVLDLPIFVGQPKRKFTVDICIDYTDDGIQCWLESVGMKELSIEARDGIIDNVLERVMEIAKIPVIELN